MVRTIIALYDVGAFLGAIAAAFMAEGLGRKRTSLVGAIIVGLGASLMGRAGERIQFMVARVVAVVGRVGDVCNAGVSE